MPEEYNDALDYRGKARVQTFFREESKTVQSQAKDADINEVLRKYPQVSIAQHLKDVDARYMDVSEFTDLQDALNQMEVAKEEFMKLPSKMRELFNHSVAEWLDAAHDPEKQAEIEAIINPPEVVVTPATPEASEPTPEVPVTE